MQYKQLIRWTSGLILLLIYLFLSVGTAEASQITTLTKILSRTAKHSDDMLEVGKDLARSGNIILKKTDKDELLKLAPHLAGKSDDVLRTSKALVNFCQQGEKQIKFMSAIDNPVDVLKLEKAMPGIWQIGDASAEIIASSNKILPQQMINTIKQHGGDEVLLQKITLMLGNYDQATNSFMELVKRGGKRSIEISKKLIELAKDNKKVILGTSATVAASALLVWYYNDPVGSSDAISQILAMPVKFVSDVSNKTGQAMTNSLFKNTDSFLINLVKNLLAYWYLSLIALIILLFIFIPSLRKTPLLALNTFVERLNDKLANKAKK